jgi:hypothetical protein
MLLADGLVKEPGRRLPPDKRPTTCVSLCIDRAKNDTPAKPKIGEKSFGEHGEVRPMSRADDGISGNTRLGLESASAPLSSLFTVATKCPAAGNPSMTTNQES